MVAVAVTAAVVYAWEDAVVVVTAIAVASAAVVRLAVAT